MDEIQFRTLMHRAVGDETMRQSVAPAVRARLGENRRGHARGGMTLAAILLAALVVTGLVVPQLLARRSILVIPATSPSPSPAATPTPQAVNPSDCLLPVQVESGSGPPSRVAYQVGFVNTRTGMYTRDITASVNGLPGREPSGNAYGPPPTSYSPALQRWLPVWGGQSAPDGLSYAWVRDLPVGSAYPNFKSAELHRYDVATSTDRMLWTHDGSMNAWQWDSTGIFVDVASPKGNPNPTWWLVDPVSGAARHSAPPPGFGFKLFKPLPGDPHDVQFTSLGSDAAHRTIWRFYNPDWVFYETAPGKRVFIYRGTQGDTTGFDPSEQAMVDSTGIWFSDHEHQTIWHWRQDTGLHKVTLRGLPAAPKGANAYVYVALAGPCF
jgi:hypothetical protein